jgi:hypothetical protein
MPWRNYSNLTHSDATAIAAYLKSLPPINNRIPGPVTANEAASGLRGTVQLPAPEAAAGKAGGK